MIVSVISTRSTPGKAKQYNEGAVPGIHTTKLTEPKTDPHLQAAGERVKAAAEELEHLGIADKTGTRVRTDLPEDMREGSDRDFCG
jgi:hypothetical protein